MPLNSRVPLLFMALTAPFGLLAQQAGVPTEWDVQKLVQAVATQSARLEPLVEEIHPKEWVSAGAPAAYIQQWDSARAQARTLKLSSDNLVQEPARLTAALDTYFRLQNLEVSLSSLLDGVRKYQNPALADLLRSVIAENNASGQQLRQYLVDLAANKEQEFKVMDQEAQRCREIVIRPGAAPARKKLEK
jgi:hypothetical protein